MNTHTSEPALTEEDFKEAAEAVMRFHNPPKSPSIGDQLAVYERAGTELRRRMKEERQRLVSDFERRLAAYEADVRATIIDMQAAHEHELQAHDRLVKRFGTLG